MHISPECFKCHRAKRQNSCWLAKIYADGLISERAIRKTPVFKPVDLSAFSVVARKLAEAKVIAQYSESLEAAIAGVH